MSKYFIGIDPGMKGAIAIIKDAALITAKVLPTHTIWGHTVIDPIALKRIIDESVDGFYQNCYALSEKVNSHKQGRTSAFGFGANSLGLINLFYAWGINVIPPVAPNAWKKEMGLSADKEKSIAMAKTLYPTWCEVIGKNDNIAEAILIATIASVSCKEEKK